MADDFVGSPRMKLRTIRRLFRWLARLLACKQTFSGYTKGGKRTLAVRLRNGFRYRAETRVDVGYLCQP